MDPNLTFVEWSGTQLNAYFHHLSETAAKHRPRVRPGFKPDGTPDGTLGLSDISGRLSAYNYGLPPTDTEVLKLLMQVIVFYPHACIHDRSITCRASICSAQQTAAGGFTRRIGKRSWRYGQHGKGAGL